MVKLLRRLISRLGDTLDAWDKFKRKDIGYFLIDNGVPTESRVLTSSVNEVDNVFLELNSIVKKLRQLEKGLVQDSPQGVSDLSVMSMDAFPYILGFGMLI
jgi:hypothetical protein